MSELKRFGERVNEQNDFEITECLDGIFVLYKDYVKLEAENEHLRKAGDDLYSLIIVLDYCLGNPEKDNPAKQAWLDAKEGRDAK